MPDYGGQWIWNDETEACVLRLMESDRRYLKKKRVIALDRFMKRALDTLGDRTNLNMASAAVAYHLSRTTEWQDPFNI